MDIKKTSIYLFSVIFALFCLFFTAASLLVPSFWHGSQAQFVLPNGKLNFSLGQALALLLFSSITVLFYLALYRIFSRLTAAWLKGIAAGLFSLLLLIESIVIILFRGMQPPEIDGGHIYLIALHMLKYGTLAGDLHYLQLYPNNLPITVARYLLYRFFAFGNPANYMLVDKIAATVFLDAGIFFSWLLVVKLSNHKSGNLLLVLTITCLPFFLYIPYFYTESLALMFPSLTAYVWYRYSRTKRPACLLLLGLLLALGCQIRENMVLFIPALLIYMLYVLRPKKVVIGLLIILAAFLPATFGAQAYYKHLGFQPDNSLKAPATHWVVLGLSRQGKYNTADTLLSLSKPTQQEKKQADIALIKKRIEKRGTSGLIKLWAVKAVRTFSVGSQSYTSYGNNPDHFSAAYRYVFGSQKQLLLFIIQFLHAAALFLLTLSALRFFRVKKYDINLLLQICLFGSFLFFIFLWEAEPRYSLLFTPFMLIGAVYGLEELHHLLDRKILIASDHKWSPVTIGRLVLAGYLLTSLVICAVLNQNNLTQAKAKYQDYAVNQVQHRGTRYGRVDARHNVEQTFITDKPFNRVAFKPVRYSGKANYRLSLLAQNGNSERTVFQRTFTSRKKAIHGSDAFLLKKYLPGGGRHYKMRISEVSGSPGSKLTLFVNGGGSMFEQQDMYPKGQFFQNGKAIKNTDLTFSASREFISPYMKHRVYYSLFLASALMVAVYTWSSLVPFERDSAEERPLNVRQRAVR
ncbi:hypothetical protein EWI07_09390 [Sporolactobacillus sp. THM7-4]|nr:hypothetical protein EWI07_09390 [Sporolactobacillus sp. THM7-4]